MRRTRYAFALLPLLAGVAFAGDPPPAAGPVPPDSRPTSTASAQPGGPGGPGGVRPGMRNDQQRRMPGRVVIAEVLAADEAAKTLKIKALNGDVIDVVATDISRMPEKFPVVGEMIRCRFDKDGDKNVILFAQFATQAMKMRLKAAGSAAPAPEPGATSTPAP